MSAHPDSAAELILAVDAGGSKSAACVARTTGLVTHEILGRGHAGGANPLSVGFDGAIEAISAAVAAAWKDAKLPAETAGRAVLSIAGAADPTIAGEFARRVRDAKLAERIAIVSDVLPVLAAGTGRGVGIALIAGTGSSAYGRAEDGRTLRCGGWGYLLGDDGSGYSIGRAALRLVLADFEANGDARSQLAAILLQELRVTAASPLIKATYTNANPRAFIASLAPRVAEAAESHDPAARKILDEAAGNLVRLVARTAKSLGLDNRKFPLALAGGVLVGSQYLQEEVVSQLHAMQLKCEIRVVDDPLVGCLRLADPEFSGSIVEWR